MVKKDLSDGFKLPSKKAAPAPMMERFIEAGESKPNKGVTSKRNATAGARCVVYLKPKVLKALRHKCFDDERSVSDAVNELVEKWLNDS
jgi:hypothetical protein